MKKRLWVLAGMCLLPALIQAETTLNWPHWRGPNTNGLVHGSDPPVEWNENKNIRWKAAIPGQGHATPIVWENRIFVQTAVQTDKGWGLFGNQATQQFKVLALDRTSGKVIWEKTVRQAAPHEGTHATASYASPSGATDGEHLYAFFGSQGLYCLDMNGNVKWEKDLGDMEIRNSFGEGSSPTLHGDKIIISWDHQGDSFIVALDKKTGKEHWRTERNEGTSWVTPLVVEHNGKHQIIVSASTRTCGYDLNTGKLIWECAGLGSNVIPMPVYANGVVYVSSGHRSPAMQAIALDKAQGDITHSDAVLWSIDRDTPYVSSPLLYGDKLYFLKNRNAVLSCYNAATGEPFYGPLRLQGMSGVYASLVGVQDRVYIAGLEGTTLVIKNSPQFEILATNTLNEGIAASPVVVGNELYLRGHEHLYCIASE